MPFSPAYNPTASFSNDETNQVAGRSTVRTVALDTELTNVASSINSLKTNLEKLQRDDGKPKDFLVEPYALAEQTRALMATGGKARGLWAAGTVYAAGDVVQQASVAYICYTAHTASNPFTISGFWIGISADGSASGSAAAAASSASAAATSATTATTQAGIATTQATNSATSATNSANSATASGNSATAAANSQTAAAANEAATAAIYDSFDDRYLGAKAVAPALDNDGAALLTGSLYWDTSIPGMRAYTGTAWTTLPAATAGAVANTPSGGVTELEVQGAINGLETRKAALADLAASSGASLVGFMPAGTGAVVTTVQSKLREGVSVLDFGANTIPGTTDMTAAFNAAITASFGFVYVPAGTYKITSSILLKTGIRLIGAGRVATTINYAGAGGYAIASATPGARIYDSGVSDLTIVDVATGSTALYLDSVSTSDFTNLTLTGFDNGAVIYSPVDGNSVYNRFTNITAQGCTNGYICNGTGSNATRFLACRFNGSTVVGTTAWSFINANGCSVTDSDIDFAGVGFSVTSPLATYSDSNMFKGNRIEMVTTAFTLGVDVRYTHISDNFYQAVPTILIDSGTRNNFFDPPNNSIEQFAGVNQAAGTKQIVRTSDGGVHPFVVIRDSINSGIATPTLQIENESTSGVLLTGKRGGVLLYSVTASGQVAVGNLQLQRGYGFGSPEGAVTAPPGSTYQRQDAGPGIPAFYVKEAGTGNTGWVAK